MHQAGDNMLPGMILHQIKPARPVDPAMHHPADRKRPVRIMHHPVVRPPLHIKHLHSAVLRGLQRSPVRRLSTALRIEARILQHNLKGTALLPALRAFHYCRVELPPIRILIKPF